MEKFCFDVSPGNRDWRRVLGGKKCSNLEIPNRAGLWRAQGPRLEEKGTNVEEGCYCTNGRNAE